MVPPANDNDFRQQLIAEHLHLPYVLALKVSSRVREHHLEDLVASGRLGLVQAAARFRPNAGSGFSTFAWSRVRGAIHDHLRETGPWKRGQILAYKAADPARKSDVPFDPRVDADLPTAETRSPEDDLDRRRLQMRLYGALKTLPERQRRIAELHYFKGYQLNEIAREQLGIARSYVTRLHQSALARLQQALNGPCEEVEPAQKAA